MRHILPALTTDEGTPTAATLAVVHDLTARLDAAVTGLHTRLDDLGVPRSRGGFPTGGAA